MQESSARFPEHLRTDRRERRVDTNTHSLTPHTHTQYSGRHRRCCDLVGGETFSRFTRDLLSQSCKHTHTQSGSQSVTTQADAGTKGDPQEERSEQEELLFGEERRQKEKERSGSRLRSSGTRAPQLSCSGGSGGCSTSSHAAPRRLSLSLCVSDDPRQMKHHRQQQQKQLLSLAHECKKQRSDQARTPPPTQEEECTQRGVARVSADRRVLRLPSSPFVCGMSDCRCLRTNCQLQRVNGGECV